ncbi:MAG TPA: DUF4230 domain-containing protein [Thermoanaerobaculia bacterium]|nr:DUF4230 domain-containing protein [Thermoanaerobaculia bacterium]
MRRRTFYIAAGAIVTAMAVGYFLVDRLISRTSATASQMRDLVVPKETQVDLDVLVTRVSAMSRLETASMHVVHISTIKQSYGVIPTALAGESLTFLGVGDVVAGVDLSQVTRKDIHRDPDGAVVLVLPPPQILVTRLNNQQSRVLNRQIGFFSKSDVDIESHARAHAEAGIRNEAYNKGILRIASVNAEKQIADFLLATGYKRIRFESRPVSKLGG